MVYRAATYRRFPSKKGRNDGIEFTASTKDGWRVDAKDMCFKKWCSISKMWEPVDRSRGQPTEHPTPVRMQKADQENVVAGSFKLPLAPTNGEKDHFAKQANFRKENPPLVVEFSGTRNDRRHETSVGWKHAARKLFSDSKHKIDATKVIRKLLPIKLRSGPFDLLTSFWSSLVPSFSSPRGPRNGQSVGRVYNTRVWDRQNRMLDGRSGKWVRREGQKYLSSIEPSVWLVAKGGKFNVDRGPDELQFEPDHAKALGLTPQGKRTSSEGSTSAQAAEAGGSSGTQATRHAITTSHATSIAQGHGVIEPVGAHESSRYDRHQTLPSPKRTFLAISNQNPSPALPPGSRDHISGKQFNVDPQSVNDQEGHPAPKKARPAQIATATVASPTLPDQSQVHQPTEMHTAATPFQSLSPPGHQVPPHGLNRLHSAKDTTAQAFAQATPPLSVHREQIVIPVPEHDTLLDELLATTQVEGVRDSHRAAVPGGSMQAIQHPNLVSPQQAGGRSAVSSSASHAPARSSPAPREA